MAVCMTFPDTLDEFLEQYQFKDEKEVYTNGSMLIPVFRVKQWAEHIPAVDAVEVRQGEWRDDADNIERRFHRHDFHCSICNTRANYFVGGVDDWWDSYEPNYCPNCGARMDGEEEHNAAN